MQSKRKSEYHASGIFFGAQGVKVLKLDCLGIGANQSLNLLVEAVFGLSFLEALAIGEMRKTLTPEVFFNRIAIMMSKRGLRKFYCHLAQGSQAKIQKEDLTRVMLDMKTIIRANPSLEIAELSDSNSSMSLTSEIQKWT